MPSVVGCVMLSDISPSITIERTRTMYHHGKGPFGPDLGTFARNVAGLGMGGP